MHNPFDDLEPREELRSQKSSNDTKKQRKEGVKNFKLISFGDEAEQDESEVVILSKDQPKVTQDDEPKSPPVKKERKKKNEEKSTSSKSQTPPPHKKSVEKVEKVVEKDDSESDSDFEFTMEKERQAEKERKKKEIQQEIENLKKDYHKEKKEKLKKDEEEASSSSLSMKKSSNSAVRDYLDEKEKYKRNKINVKGATRENYTLQLLEKFKAKIHSKAEANDDDANNHDDADNDDSWMTHKLDFSESQIAVLAKDASKKEDDWYDIFDPRNPLNKRKRGIDEKSSKRRK